MLVSAHLTEELMLIQGSIFIKILKDTNFANSKSKISSNWRNHHLVSYMQLWVAQEAGSSFLLYFPLQLYSAAVHARYWTDHA